MCGDKNINLLLLAIARNEYSIDYDYEERKKKIGVTITTKGDKVVPLEISRLLINQYSWKP